MKQQMLANQKGRIVDVLWEQEKTNHAGQQICTGYAPNYLKVETVLNNAVSESNSTLKNTITQVQINGFSTETLNLQGILL
jgi:hypothetical protein